MMPSQLKHFRFTFNAMGTLCEIQLFAKNTKSAKRISEEAIRDVQRLESKYSRYRVDSLLSRINNAASTGRQLEVDAETASLLDYAHTCYQQSDGLFDISSGILRKAWQFKESKLPEPILITELLEKVGWEKVDWHRPVLTFKTPGMEIDFGGIVKEYAADRVAALCHNQGCNHGLINLGGDVKIIGPRPDESPWHIGISHPRDKQNMLETITLSRGAIASSGDYERCMLIDGVRYGHILNPKTGWPVQKLSSVTVISDFCVIAGSAATIAMLKEAEGPGWLAELGLPYIWTDSSGQQAGPLSSQ